MSAHKYLLRVPEDIWLEVRAAAVRNRRSVNQEIVWRLSEGVSDRAATGAGSDALVVGETPAAVPLREPLDAVGVPADATVGKTAVPVFRPDFKGER
jgi:hypothetical protein